MACKKPVLMAIDGVSRKLIEDANCGVYAEPENVEDIVGQINLLRSNPNLNQMGENGYKYAKANFDRQLIAKEYIDLIQLHLKGV